MTEPPKPSSAVPVSGWRLRVLVFVSGAVLMGLEMAASRVLATHFGSSIYVWGAIISVFLAALSVGYVLGGKLADARPSFFLLNTVVFAAGCWQLLIPFYAHPFCRALVQSNLGERMGPLLATLVLFGGPSILMGMASPFAVRLAARSMEKLGIVAGQLYAISTFGSIAGTLLTAFWLIPDFGVRTVLLVLAAALAALPFVLLPGSRAIFLLAAPLAVIGPAAFILEPPETVPLRAGQRKLFETDSAYHHILVTEDDAWDARWLQFNNYIESGVGLRPPWPTRTTYTDSFELARVFRPDLKRILVIGGGGGIGPRKFTSDDPDVVVDLVEIDPVVVEVAKRWFHLVETERLRIHVEDGRRFVRRSRGPYDLVILDAYTIGGQIPFHLTTQEFMKDIQRVLAPGGVLLANINSSLEGRKSRVLRSEAKTFESVFGGVHVFPRRMEFERGKLEPVDRLRTRNVMLIALNGNEPWDKAGVIRSAAAIVAAGRQPTPTFYDDAVEYLETPLPTHDVPLLTDDHAPVDTMAF
ncbi:MAG: fused MFS/spermidine synthase [Candidatus Brocadiae bacterium]|nr:fused MFS/spermidine synthase [Candidatus Brocadiia bacterium]